mmetsp:Transcript_15873/g.31893  ORF Transcript_15873/g.31893 Transcript_15873/m.31893 type:complete len:103 (+) Transcript_15873:158-466(+)
MAAALLSTVEDWPWCIAMFDGRPANNPKSYWAAAPVLNWEYAEQHAYGFTFAHLIGNQCHHETHGRRRAAWCKIPAVAQVLLHGIDGRRCANVLYLDTDAGR